MKSTNIINFRKYPWYHIFSEAIDTRASGGVTITIKKTIPHREIILKTNLQAVAVTLLLDKTTTLCSIYIPSSYSLDGNKLEYLISQLTPFILIGDMIANSTLWGNTRYFLIVSGIYMNISVAVIIFYHSSNIITGQHFKYTKMEF